MTLQTNKNPRYFGDGSFIFWLAVKTGLLTLITLGIYRFWAKTRVRRYVWHSTELDGSRFEYTGTGLEKFLGFLIAVVILAVYLGIVQILLGFIGLSAFVVPDTPQQAFAQSMAVNLSFISIIPLLYFAAYRARRYKMARTRWRGIRFGMENGAWGYAFRALGYGFLTVVTLGILTPLATFRLEKYMTDRSRFGDGHFVQEGNWIKLYRPLRHVLYGVGVLLASMGIIAAFQMGFGPDLTPLAFIGLVIGYVWVLIGVVYYNVHSFRYLTSHKVLHGEIRFTAEPTTGKIISIYLIGSLAIGLLMAVFGGIISVVVGAQMAAFANNGADFPFFQLVQVAISYFLLLIFAGAGALALIVQPIIRHYVETLSVLNIDALASITQRAADDGADAEGFADALDFGGAI